MTKHWFTAYLTHHYSKGKKLALDLGSGKRNWKEFFQCRCIGLDLPTEIGNEVGKKPDVCGTANSLPFSDDTFDFLTCYSVIPYVENVDDAFREIRRVLKPDGVAVMIVQNPRGMALHMNEQNYINKFDSKTLNKRLVSHGFRSIRFKNLKAFIFSYYYNLTSVYAYAIIQPTKKSIS